MRRNYLGLGLVLFLGCKEITWKTETIVHVDGTTDRNITLLTNIEFDSLQYYFRLPSEKEGWRWEKTKNIDATREKKKEVFNLKIEKFHKEIPFRIPADFYFRDWKDTTVRAENHLEVSGKNFFLFRDYSYREVFHSTSPKEIIRSTLDTLSLIYSAAWLKMIYPTKIFPEPFQKEIREEVKNYFIQEIAKTDTGNAKPVFLEKILPVFQKYGFAISKDQISVALDSAEKFLDRSEPKKAEKITDQFTGFFERYRGRIDDISFEQVLDMPGSIRSTNGTLLSDNRVRWKFSANHYILSDYILEARSRKIQWHIIIIGLILVYWGVRKIKSSVQKTEASIKK